MAKIYDRCVDCGTVYTGGYHLMRCPACKRRVDNAASNRSHAKARYGNEPTVCPMCARPTGRASGFCICCERKLIKQNRLMDSYMGARVSYA